MSLQFTYGSETYSKLYQTSKMELFIIYLIVPLDCVGGSQAKPIVVGVLNKSLGGDEKPSGGAPLVRRFLRGPLLQPSLLHAYNVTL